VTSAQPAAIAEMGFDLTEAYAEHAPFLVRVLKRLTGDSTHVEDLLQETFIIALKRRRAFAGRSTVRTWLYGIARNLAWRHNRGAFRWLRFRSRLAIEPPPAGGDPGATLERKQHSALVQGALAELPLKQREVLVLFELEGMSGEEIAELLGINRNAVWARLHVARKTFTAVLKRALPRDEEA
jgi:RNA polymerase sigma-70 factor (ECF subfamily)